MRLIKASIILVFILFVKFNLFAQILNLPNFDPGNQDYIARDIHLLPNSMSYVLRSETYFKDSLISKNVLETFYNYGNERYCFENDVNFLGETNSVCILKKLSDTLWLQTNQYFEYEGINCDSIIVKLKNGKIIESEERRDGKHYQSNLYKYDNDFLIQKIYINTQGDSSLNSYHYQDGKLKFRKSISKDDLVYKIEYQYIDSILNVFNYSNQELVSKRIFKFNSIGKVSEKIEFRRDLESLEMKQIHKINYSYNAKNELVKIESLNSLNRSQTTEIDPEDSITFKYLWMGKNKKQLRRYEFF